MPARIAVFASGGGTNLQALIDRFHGAEGAPARVELVVGSRGGIGALRRAEEAGIASVALSARICGPEAFPAALLAALREREVELVVLAGYLHLVPLEVVRTFRGRMLNVHPALLPAFGGKGMYGIRVHQAVLDSGARISGATVHLVDERYDEGRIVAQWPVPVLPDDSPQSLAERVLAVEHLLLPAAVEALVDGRAGEPLVEPLAFDLVPAPAPPPEALRRLSSERGKPVTDSR